MINDKYNLKQALANHVARAAEKLRHQDSLCGEICVFINTNRFRKKDLQYNNSATLTFNDLTNNTTVIIQQAFKLLESLYRPNYNYRKLELYYLI